MKLQTWITWLCCTAVFVATLVVDLFVWNAEYRNMQKEAQTKALSETYNMINAYAMEFNMKEGSVRAEDQILDSRLQYAIWRIEEWRVSRHTGTCIFCV